MAGPSPRKARPKRSLAEEQTLNSENEDELELPYSEQSLSSASAVPETPLNKSYRRRDSSKSTGRSGTPISPSTEGACGFCKEREVKDLRGDLLGPFTSKGRDYFTHDLCSCFAPEVHHNVRGIPQHVPRAIHRASRFRCSLCGRGGAALHCDAKGCSLSYHLHCSIADGCTLDMEKYTMLCPGHSQESHKRGSAVLETSPSPKKPRRIDRQLHFSRVEGERSVIDGEDEGKEREEDDEEIPMTCDPMRFAFAPTQARAISPRPTASGSGSMEHDRGRMTEEGYYRKSSNHSDDLPSEQEKEDELLKQEESELKGLERRMNDLKRDLASLDASLHELENEKERRTRLLASTQQKKDASTKTIRSLRMGLPHESPNRFGERQGDHNEKSRATNGTSSLTPTLPSQNTDSERVSPPMICLKVMADREAQTTEVLRRERTVQTADMPTTTLSRGKIGSRTEQEGSSRFSASPLFMGLSPPVDRDTNVREKSLNDSNSKKDQQSMKYSLLDGGSTKEKLDEGNDFSKETEAEVELLVGGVLRVVHCEHTVSCIAVGRERPLLSIGTFSSVDNSLFVSTYIAESFVCPAGIQQPTLICQALGCGVKGGWQALAFAGEEDTVVAAAIDASSSTLALVRDSLPSFGDNISRYRSRLPPISYLKLFDEGVTPLPNLRVDRILAVGRRVDAFVVSLTDCHFSTVLRIQCHIGLGMTAELLSRTKHRSDFPSTPCITVFLHDINAIALLSHEGLSLFPENSNRARECFTLEHLRTKLAERSALIEQQKKDAREKKKNIERATIISRGEVNTWNTYCSCGELEELPVRDEWVKMQTQMQSFFVPTEIYSRSYQVLSEGELTLEWIALEVDKEERDALRVRLVSFLLSCPPPAKSGVGGSGRRVEVGMVGEWTLMEGSATCEAMTKDRFPKLDETKTAVSWVTKEGKWGVWSLCTGQALHVQQDKDVNADAPAKFRSRFSENADLRIQPPEANAEPCRSNGVSCIGFFGAQWPLHCRGRSMWGHDTHSAVCLSLF